MSETKLRERKLRLVLADLSDAKDIAETELHDLFPVGSSVTWDRAGHRQHGTVEQHLYGLRIRVRNRYTNKEYAIHASDIARRP
jgi:hypothetical protein